MTNLIIREDDWSLQIRARNSARFFIRLTKLRMGETSLVFSEFIINPDENARALEALHAIKDQFSCSTSITNMVFQHIYLSQLSKLDYAELIVRHDQIVAVVKEYTSQVGLTVENALLEPRAGVFETVVLIR